MAIENVVIITGFVFHREEAVLASLVDLSRFRLILSEDRRMIVDMLPPNLADSSVLAQDSSEIHPSLASSVSELSQPLRVTITFASADQTSVASIQVCACVLLFCLFDNVV